MMLHALLKSIITKGWRFYILSSFPKFVTTQKFDLSLTFLGDTPLVRSKFAFYMRESCVQDFRKYLIYLKYLSTFQMVTFLMQWTYNSFKPFFWDFFINP